MKILGEARIEDFNCKQILAAVPSDFPLLKGADYIVAESAKSLGLPVCVRPFLGQNYTYSCFLYGLKDFSNMFHFEDLEWAFATRSYDNDDECLQVFGEAVCRCKSQDITWCQKLVCDQPAGAVLAYGNQASLELWYKSAAILIRIPKWSEYHQKLIAISTGENHDNTKASCSEIDDGVVKDFKDVIQEYEDFVEEETLQHALFKQLLDNDYIRKSEELTDKLKQIQMMLCICGTKDGWNAKKINKVKGYLRSLEYRIRTDGRNIKLEYLRREMDEFWRFMEVEVKKL